MFLFLFDQINESESESESELGRTLRCETALCCLTASFLILIFVRFVILMKCVLCIISFA